MALYSDRCSSWNHLYNLFIFYLAFITKPPVSRFDSQEACSLKPDDLQTNLLSNIVDILISSAGKIDDDYFVFR